MEAIVLYPSPGMGHLVSMVELGKLILTHHPSFTINILLARAPYFTGSTAEYIAEVSTTAPSIIFHHFPSLSLALEPASYSSAEALMFDLIRLNNLHVHNALQSISTTSTIHAFVIDLFCATALDVAIKLDIPIYHFFTSGASCLALFLYLPKIAQNTIESFKDLETTVSLPCLPPIPLSHMPMPILERGTVEYVGVIECMAKLAKSAGIIANTFESLEPKAVKALADGVCVPDGPTPPIFCIGPLIATNRQSGADREDNGPECLSWLDKQPSGSVVFLCFGSIGLHSKEQLREIATGLERSDQRFLWVVRNPPSEDKSQGFLARIRSDPDLNFLLPDGFLDRTKDRGLVVKLWAPQIAVLNHDSIGGFVSHCGWNSILESLCAGVPMVAWPLYAEQKINKALLVDEFKLSLPMNESENGFVRADEVEKRVRELMDSEKGNSVREQVVAKRQETVKAMGEGGTSRVALAKLVELWKKA